jgi:excisionase family DNA binding protein
MSFEETLGALLEARIAPLRAEISLLAAKVEAVRQALPPALVTMPEAARLLGLSVRTVRRQVKAGKLPSCRVGRGVRVDLASLKPLTEEQLASEACRLRVMPT